MGDWTDREIFEEKYWWTHYTFFPVELDRRIEPFLKVPAAGIPLRELRTALLIPATRAAKKLGLNRSAFSRMERAEEQGTISLNTLKKCAEAIDCELVYAIRPKCRNKLSDVIWDQIFPHLKPKPSSRLWSLARDKLNDPRFRRARGWMKNTNKNRV